MRKDLQIGAAGFIENLKNAAGSNDLLAVYIEGQPGRTFLEISWLQKEDGSANNFNVAGTLLIIGIDSTVTSIKGKAFISYARREVQGNGFFTYEDGIKNKEEITTTGALKINMGKKKET